MTGARPLAAGTLVVVAASGFSACESTQDKSARLQHDAAHFVNNKKGLSITTPNRYVHVVSSQLLRSRGRAAAVVVMRNTSAKPQVAVPVAINVTGAGGKSVFKNNLPGIEPSLTAASYVAPHQQLTWINDQIIGQGPTRVSARVGPAALRSPRLLPKVTVTAPTFLNDPVSGPEASGIVTNRSKILQAKLIVSAVARKGSKIVAVGRASIPKLRPGRPAHYHIFFVGNARGAAISVQAPPTTFK